MYRLYVWLIGWDIATYDMIFSSLLGVLGILITVFTVVYSFQENARQKRNALKIEIRTSKQIDPISSSTLKFTEDFIARQLDYNKKVVFLIAFCLFNMALYGIMQLWNNKIIRLVFGVAIFVFFFLCLVAICIYIYQYRKNIHNK